MSAEFQPGDRVRWADDDRAVGKVLRVWTEVFEQGGEQQVVEVAERGTGQRFSMRSTHLTLVSKDGATS